MNSCARATLQVILALSLTVDLCPPALPSLASSHARRVASGASEFENQSLAAALTFVRTVFSPSGFEIRRWLSGNVLAWAWAGDAPVRTQVWEFEPAPLYDLHAPLRSEDSEKQSSGERPPSSESPVFLKAKTLLENMRASPMAAGAVDEGRRILRTQIWTAIEGQGVPNRLAARVAFQLVHKFDPRDLGDVQVWQAIGKSLNDEVRQLRRGLRLNDNQIITGLPKLSAREIVSLFQETKQIDIKMGRSIAAQALRAADPVATGRRYSEAFKGILNRLKAIDRKVARSLAGAAFAATLPEEKSILYLTQFQKIVSAFGGDYAFARVIASLVFSAPDPLRTAERFISRHNAIVAELTARNLEPTIVRTIAGRAAKSPAPLATARRFLENFEAVVALTKRSHPSIARTVGLKASVAADPIALANTFLANYDRVVQVISETEPSIADSVAAQTFWSRDAISRARRLAKHLIAPQEQKKRKSPPLPLILFLAAAAAFNPSHRRPSAVLTTAA
jgi:hypothetical protein